jgi:hypothetical protein
VVLPRAGVADALVGVDVLSAVALCRQQGARRKGTLWMPRFQTEGQIELSEQLQRLGAPRAFTNDAEFPGVSTGAAGALPLKVDQVIHKVKVEVDEEGTVAAAATAVVASFGCAAAPPAGPPPFAMRCDRPFAFCVVALHPSPLVLFAGTVTNPGCVGAAPPAPATSPFPFATVSAPGGGGGGGFRFGVPAAAAAAAAQLDLQARSEQAVLFTPACRRDVYRVLCSEPRGALRGGPAPAAPGGGGLGFGAFGAPAAPPPPPPPSTAPPLRFVLPPQPSAPPLRLVRTEQLDAASRGAAIEATLRAVEIVGEPTPAGVAFTEAFEQLLVQEYVGWWSDEDGASLSVAFRTAFGNELTPRLDLPHALRGRALPREDVAWLRTLPPAIPFDRRLLDVFQA